MRFLKYDLSNCGLLGDIHASLQNLNEVLKLIDYNNRRKIITLGDYWDRGSEPNEVIDILFDLYTCGKLIPILGNHDHKFIRYFSETNSKVSMGEEQKKTLEKLKDGSIEKLIEILNDKL